MRNKIQHPGTSSTGRIFPWCLLLCFSISNLENAPSADAFLPSHHGKALTCSVSVILQATTGSSYDPEEEVNRRLARAKEVLKKSKAKLESRASQATAGGESKAPVAAALPFFASKKVTVDPQRRERVIKARDDKTGLVTADGEKMAAMSEQEEWQVRSLFEVFENEMGETADVYSQTSLQLADRDLVAGVWNLRKSMHNDDYAKIFDKRNRFIGEDN
jgi:hypothetical protein